MGDGTAGADARRLGEQVGLMVESEGAELVGMHALKVRSIADRTGPQLRG